MWYRNSYKVFIVTVLLTVLFSGCKKFTEIDPPINSLLPGQAFGDDLSANASVNGIYATMTSSSLLSGNVTSYLGLSSDELIKNFPDNRMLQVMNNELTADNSIISSIWGDFYKVIGQANACLAGLGSSTGLNIAMKTQLTGEAKFMRAYSYFYLVNLFGDVPLLINSDWVKTTTITRTAEAEVYKQIIQDLLDAKSALPAINPSGAITRATKWAATALLARVYLYQKNWVEAENQATSVINAPEFNMPLPALADVFLIGSTEAIFQLVPVSYYKNPYDYTNFYAFGSIGYKITDTLLKTFDPGDQRQTTWLRSKVVSGQTIYYPYKYYGEAFSGNAIEYNVMLRISEQYLIRAEARARQNKIPGAVNDLNVIRTRAGLPGLLTTLSQAEAITATEKERQLELFAEWGHRWLDLKRMPGAVAGKTRADEVLGKIKGTKWQSTDLLYPIPKAEIILNGNLSQNNGY